MSISKVLECNKQSKVNTNTGKAAQTGNNNKNDEKENKIRKNKINRNVLLMLLVLRLLLLQTNYDDRFLLNFSLFDFSLSFSPFNSHFQVHSKYFDPFECSYGWWQWRMGNKHLLSKQPHTECRCERTFQLHWITNRLCGSLISTSFIVRHRHCNNWVRVRVRIMRMKASSSKTGLNVLCSHFHTWF